MTFDPTQNRVPTCLLTADELAVLGAAQHGWEYVAPPDTDWVTSHGHHFSGGYIYRAKPAPAPTLSITVNGVTNVVAAPVSEKMADGQAYWVPNPGAPDLVSALVWDSDKADRRCLGRGLIHTSEAAARAHAMAMVGLKAEGV